MSEENQVRVDITGSVEGLQRAAVQAAYHLNQIQAAGEKAAGATEKQTRAANVYLEALQKEAAFLGRSAADRRLLEVGMQTLTDAQRQHAVEIVRSINAYEALEERQLAVARGVKIVGAAMGAAAVAAVQLGKSVLDASASAEQIDLKLTAALKATGLAAGVTRDEIEGLAQEMKGSTLFDDDQVKAAAAAMLTFRDVQGSTFKEGLRLAADWAAMTGDDLVSKTYQLGRALESPSQALGALERVIGKFSPAQREMIKNLEESGRLAEAQAIILDRLQESIGGTARELNTGFKQATQDSAKEWDELLKTIGRTKTYKSTVNAFFEGATALLHDMRLEIEGTKTPLSDLLELYEKISRLSSPVTAVLAMGGAWPGQPAKPTAPAPSQPSAAARAAADAGREKQAQDRLLQQRDQFWSEYKTKNDKIAAEIERAKNLFGAGTKDYNAAVAAIQQKYKAAGEGSDSHRSATDRLAKSLREKLALEQAELANGKPLTDIQKLRVSLELQLAEAQGKITPQRRAELQADIDSIVTAAEKNKLRAEWLRLQGEDDKATAKRIDDINQSAASTQAEVDGFGLAKSAIEALAISRLEERRIKEASAGASENTLRALDEEIAARKKLATALGQKEVLEANKKAAEDVGREWKQISDDVNRAVTEDILKGGKNGLEHLKDYARTYVVRVGVQWVTSPITGAIQGAFGVPSTVSGGGFGGGMNLLSMGNAASGASNWLNLGSMSAGFSSGVSETMLGSSFVGPSASLAGGSTGVAASIGQYAPHIAAALIAANVIQSVWGHKPHAPEGSVYQMGGEGGGAENAFGYWNPWSYNRAFTAGMRPGQEAITTRIGAADQALYSVLTPAEIARVKASLASDTADRLDYTDINKAGSAIEAERKMLILKGLGPLFEQLGAAIPYDQLGQFVGQVRTLQTQLAAVDPALGDLTPTLINAFGGMQNFSAAFGAYVDATYSDAEKLTLQRTQLESQFTQLGQAMPQSAAELRTLASGIDRTTESGARLYASVISLAPAVRQWEEANKQATDTLQNSTEILRQRRQLEIALMEATGDAAGALAARRADELGAMDASLVGLQKQIYAAQDRQRIADEATRNAETARSALISAYDSQISSQQQIADQFKSIASSLAQYRNSLALSDLSPLSPTARYTEADKQLTDLFRRAKLGDTEAAGQFQGAVQSYLEASRAVNASGSGYVADYQRAQQMLAEVQGTAERQADIAQRQVDLLKGQMDRLGLIATNTSDLNALLAQYLAAQRLAAGTSLTPAGAAAQSSINAATTARLQAAGAASGSYNNGVISGVSDEQFQRAMGLVGEKTRNEMGQSLTEWYGTYSGGRGLATPLQDYLSMLNGRDGTYLPIDYAAAKARMLEEAQRAGYYPSHADGLAAVPYDGYVAKLHKDESVISLPERRAIQRYFGVTPAATSNADVVSALRALTTEVQALVAQNGAIGTGTLGRLETVVSRLDSQRRIMARTGTEG